MPDPPQAPDLCRRNPRPPPQGRGQKGQKFADLWALVDWLAANDPAVDLLRPPQRH
jgi:hypothetical protein